MIFPHEPQLQASTSPIQSMGDFAGKLKVVEQIWLTEWTSLLQQPEITCIKSNKRNFIFI